MHEIGVLCQVVKEVEKVAEENHIDHVDGVVLEIGELTGMLPYFFEEYYDMVTENHPVVEGSRVIVETVEGKGQCLDCGEVYNVPKTEGYCTKCNSRRKRILSGQQFLIREIIINDEGAASA